MQPRPKGEQTLPTLAAISRPGTTHLADSVFACKHIPEYRIEPRSDKSAGQPIWTAQRGRGPWTARVIPAAGVCVGCQARHRHGVFSPTFSYRDRDEWTGRSQFLHCNSRHVVDAAAPPPFGDSLGAHLEDIVGRPAASVEGFEYTDELAALDLV